MRRSTAEASGTTLSARPGPRFGGRSGRLVSLLACAFVMAFGGEAAQAAPKGVVAEFGSQGSGDGQFNFPGAAAVHQATGDVFVVDRSNHRVQRFGADGSFELRFGAQGFTNGLFGNPQGIAIDQNDGWVYVADRDNRRVQKFDLDGNYLDQFGGPGSGAGQFGSGSNTSASTGFFGRVAVDQATSAVFVADSPNRRVQKFNSDGDFVAMWGWDVVPGAPVAFEMCTAGCQASPAGAAAGQFGSGQPVHIAVGSAGNVFLSDSNASNRVQRFDPDGLGSFSSVATIGVPPLLDAVTAGLAVDPTTGNLLVARDPAALAETVVQELDAASTVVDTHGVGEGIAGGTGAVGGLDINGLTGAIYLVRSAVNFVAVLDEGVPPSATLEATTDIGPTGATANGTVNPNGALARYRFEYKLASLPDDPANWTRVPQTNAPVGSGTTDVAVSQPVGPLDPNTDYQVRLIVDGWGAPVTSGPQTFTTSSLRPTIVSAGASAQATTATLRGRINPNKSATSYRFEYGTDTSYGSAVPVPDAAIGSGLSVVAVSQQLDGLEPNTTYHFRLVAANAAGVSEGPDRTFTTAPAVPQPAGRAYELVSPQDKNGNDAHNSTGAASALGDAVAWASNGSFSGQPSAPLHRGYYQSVRGPAAWATQGIALPTEPGPGATRHNLFLLSDDVSKSVTRTEAVLVPGAAPDMEKLYLHDHASGTHRLITPPPAPGGTTDEVVAPEGSPDLKHVLFSFPLPASTDKLLYHWVDDGTEDGAVSIASVLPDGTPVAGSAGSAAQDDNEFARNAISDDGSTVFFTALAGPSSNAVFRREGGETVRINEEENPDVAIACGACPAVFVGASTDGSKALFTSTQRLVAADTNDVGDLYLYTHSEDPASDDNLTLLSADNEPDAPAGADVNAASIQGGGVVAASDDLSRIYFAAANQIVAGEDPTAERKLYLWDEHDGVRYIGGLPVEVGDFKNEGLWSNQNLSYLTLRAVSPDGQSLLLKAISSTLAPGSTGGLPQVYLYQLAADQFVCVSCPGAGPTTEIAESELARPFPIVAHPHGLRNVSADGSRAFFQTSTALVPGDLNGDLDVYMWEDGSPHLISTGNGDGGADFVDASASGDDVFFATREQLVDWDIDSLRDVYDARVGGGLPGRPQPPVPCAGDECQGEPGSPPQLDKPGSSSLTGPGDEPPRPRASFAIARVSRAARARLARTGRLMLRVRVNRAGRVSLTARGRVSKRSRVVDRSSKTASRAGTVELPLRLSKAALRQLARGRTLRLSVAVRFAGVREPRTLTLTLRRASAPSNGKAG